MCVCVRCQVLPFPLVLPRSKKQKEEAAGRLPTVANMASLNKIAANSPSRQSPSELETSIANALYDLENNTQDLKASLRPLQFVSAREVGLVLASCFTQFYAATNEYMAMCSGLCQILLGRC